NCTPFEEKPQILFQTWETFFTIQCSQSEDSNELFQKLLKDLKELAEYDQSISTDRPIFLNDNEDHPVQNRESPENSSKENIVSKTNQKPPHDSDIHQLIDECCEEVPEEQKQNMEKTMLDLVKICHHKQFLCMHDDEQEVKNVVEQPAECRNRAEKSLQNYRVIHKNSISFKNTSQISSIHSIAPIESTEEPEHLLSMGYEHLSITPETESDEVTESNAENLLPIPSKFEDNDNLDSSDVESLPNEDVPEEIDIVTRSDDLLPPSDDNDDDYDFLLEEVDLFLFDNSIPPGIENVADDPEGDIRFLEELLINDSILSHESFDSSFEDNPLILRPPPEPPDDNFDLEPEVISAVMEDIDEPDEHFNPGGEIFVSTNNEDVDYFPFMFVILIFFPYLILPEISPLLLSAESEDTIFDPGIFD
nr:hypothetical protein [Tanacetum cinerariifolium]